MDDTQTITPEDDLRLLARILNRWGVTGCATPWLAHDGAKARFYTEGGELKPCARITRRAVTEGIEYEVNVFYRGKSSTANKIKDITHAKAIADLMLQQFGVTLVNEQ